MTSEEIEFVSKIDYTDVQRYLESRGWFRSRSKRDEIAIFRKDREEVLLPLDRTLADYAEAIATVAVRVANVEGATPQKVLADLRHTRSDVLRTGRTDNGTDDGSLGFAESTALIMGTRRAILAAACSVERPNERFHRRLALKNAQALIEKCRLAQTERGSFVISVLCPLDFSVTVRSLRVGGVNQVLEEVDSEKPPITANLCEALLDMMPTDERGDLWLDASWSPLVAQTRSFPRVQVDRDMYPWFEQLSRTLRPAAESKRDLFIGRVIELHGEDNEVGDLEGDVTLQLTVGDDLLRARCALGSPDYAQAVSAHSRQRYLSLKGVLRRYPKSARIEDASDVKVPE
jgi:hypothetical protein